MWLRGALVLAELVVLMWLERRRPLRPRVEPTRRRRLRNVAMVGISAAALHVTERPVSRYLTHLVARRRWGLFRRLALPPSLEVPLALLALDYTLYLWHVLLHRPPLWRFHVVHHVDLDLDTSTALRFHAGELIISVVWRAGQILLFGLSRSTLSAWQTAVLLSVLFHHSNVRIPIGMERWLNRVIVTPRMHGIHHSIVPDETGSNWSSGLTLWDALHGTLRLNVPQSRITIGTPAYRSPGELTFGRLLTLPFRPQPPAWQLLEGGAPERGLLSLPPGCLAA
jgi:sterol desaturase/sphingolipid hydroxylase (fatty acid hydroxylase superfamily)